MEQFSQHINENSQHSFNQQTYTRNQGDQLQNKQDDLGEGFQGISITGITFLNEKGSDYMGLPSLNLLYQRIDQIRKEQKPFNLQAQFDKLEEKDQQDQNYDNKQICQFCGKEYKSYPALYTHKKAKHPEEPKNKLGSNTVNRRGRPRRNEDIRLNDLEHNKIGEIIKNESDFEKKFESLLKVVEIDDIHNLFFYSQNDYQEENQDQTISYEKKGEDLTRIIPLKVKKDIKNNILEFEKHNLKTLLEEIQAKKFPKYFSSKLKCIEIIAIFLFNISKLIPQQMYDFVLLLMNSLLDCIDIYLYDEIENQIQNKQLKKEDILLWKYEMEISNPDLKFSQIENSFYIPFIAEKFILEYMPQQLPQINIQMAIYILIDFINWLKSKKFTKYFIELNQFSQKNSLMYSN